jgi:predicted transcriptional regulator of viral defense system
MNKISDLEKKLLFSAPEIASCFETEMTRRYWLATAIKERRVAKIKQGLYALINPATGVIYADKFMLASAISPTSVVVYHSALEFHGLANQVYSTVYIASDERFRPFEYGGVSYERVRDSIRCGVDVVQSSTDIKVTDLERTVIDCIDDVGHAGGEDELFAALSYVKKLNEVKLLQYLADYNKGKLYQKAGYLFEKLNDRLRLLPAFFAECKTHIATCAFHFLDSVGEPAYNRDWNIIAPAKLPFVEEII